MKRTDKHNEGYSSQTERQIQVALSKTIHKFDPFQILQF